MLQANINWRCSRAFFNFYIYTRSKSYNENARLVIIDEGKLITKNNNLKEEVKQINSSYFKNLTTQYIFFLINLAALFIQLNFPPELQALMLF